ncbi:MAG TPA: hypothetical protein PKN57_12565, partial [Saprospiraceae bacterium]|nr:hypothetical protein [Saprospiraceae bacterium]
MKMNFYKKYLLVLCLMGGFIVNSHAQGWSKSFEFYPASEGSMRHTLIDDTIYIKSYCYCYDNDECSFVCKIDTAGNVLQIMELHKSGKGIQMGAYSDILLIGDKLVTTGDDSWDNTKNNVEYQHLYKIKKTLDSMERIPIPIPDSVYQFGGNVLYFEKENIIITEELRYDPKAKDKNIEHITALGEDNQVLWSYSYKVPNPNLKMTDGGEIIKNTDTSFIVSFRLSGPYIQYFSMNTKGKLLWQYTENNFIQALYGNPNTYKPMIAPAEGTDIVRAWYYDAGLTNDDPQPEISRITNKGQVIWQHKFPFTTNFDTTRIKSKTVWHLLKTKNGDYVGVGTCLYIRNNKDWSYKFAFETGYAFRVDKDGNALWERYYVDKGRSKFGYQSFYAVAEGDDGSLYFSGHITDSIPNVPGSGLNSNIWLVKTGPDGCLTPGCDSLVSVSTKKVLNRHPDLLTVYPNPGSSELNI